MALRLFSSLSPGIARARTKKSLDEKISKDSPRRGSSGTDPAFSSIDRKVRSGGREGRRWESRRSLRRRLPKTAGGDHAILVSTVSRGDLSRRRDGRGGAATRSESAQPGSRTADVARSRADAGSAPADRCAGGAERGASDRGVERSESADSGRHAGDDGNAFHSEVRDARADDHADAPVGGGEEQAGAEGQEQGQGNARLERGRRAAAGWFSVFGQWLHDRDERQSSDRLHRFRGGNGRASRRAGSPGRFGVRSAAGLGSHRGREGSGVRENERRRVAAHPVRQLDPRSSGSRRRGRDLPAGQQTSSRGAGLDPRSRFGRPREGGRYARSAREDATEATRAAPASLLTAS